MKKRFVLGVGIGMTVGFVLGAAKASEKLLSVDDIREACKKHVTTRIANKLLNYDNCQPSISTTYTFDSLPSAEAAWRSMHEILAEFGFVTESDLYDLCGFNSSFNEYKNMNRKGWRSDDGWAFSYDNDKKGWTIYLPKSTMIFEEE